MLSYPAMKTLLSRRQFLTTAATLGASLLWAQQGKAQSVTFRRIYCPILMYHYISTPPDDADEIRLDLSVSPELFAEHLDNLKWAGYSTITMAQLWSALMVGTELPQRPILLTFDDGYADAYDYAAPILVEREMVGTFFIVSGFMGQPNYLTWAQAKEMKAAGMEIGNHSASHPNLANRDREYVRNEIDTCAAAVEANLGERTHFFCYPGGRYDETAVRAVQDSGHLAAVTVMDGTLHYTTQPYHLRRVRVRNTTTAAGLDWLINRRI